MSLIKQKIGAKIRFFRKNQLLSQEKLALISDIDRTYIAGVESGKRNISIVNLDKIIKALNMSYSDFFSDM